MRSSDRDMRRTNPGAEAFQRLYAVHRDRVDAAHERMRKVSADRHRPADARQAAAELTVALRDATAAVHALEPPAVRPWSAELVRLAEIGVWLRRTTLDDLGVHIPTVVRVGSYAANGPRIAGLAFGAADSVRLREPRIGVDLQATVDNNDRQPAPAPAPSAPARAA